MSKSEDLLAFAEELIYGKIGNYLSDLQRTILLTTLQESRKTYDQIAAECGYSPKYVKQDVAPKLWQLLSQALERKITKSNLKAILEHQMRHQPPVVESPSPVALSPVPSADEKSNQKGNILLVDDRPENLKLLSDLLEEQGYEVQQAINGVVALQAIAIARPDVILLDINMPELDGYTVCQRLKANPLTQDIPVIFVSAFDEAWDKVKAFSVGGSDYITKPFKTVEVLARVENQLKVRRLQLQLQEKNRQLQQALHQLEKFTAATLEQKNEQLRIAEENYRSIFENAVEGIFQSSPEGRFIIVNSALARIYGYDSPREMLESITNISEQLYVEPEKRTEFKKLLATQDIVKDFEFRCYCKDGSIIWAQIDARVVKAKNGNVLYYEGLVRDITERKRREDELRKQLEELKIEIDQKKREQEVAILTESSYFQEVQAEMAEVDLDEFWSS